MKAIHVPYRVRRTLVWMRRWRRTRGFGVHSPTDYHFIRYVINQHWPYYAYDTLKNERPDIDKKTRKVCKLYFRLANWLQPAETVLCQMPSTAYAQYIQAGCNQTHITDVDDTDNTPQAQLCAMTLNEETMPLIQQTLQQADDGTMIVINGIHRSRKNKKYWRQLRKQHNATLTFDVYYCGIILIRHKRTKQHYIVNY